jgi:uncharacterized protein YdiU (UPF0061 family)
VEISKKIAKGYPLNNTIFEDTCTAVLYQNGQERYRLDLTDPKQLASLLNEFYAYTEPEIDSFEQAVDEFQERVPELAKGLVEKIAEAHKTYKKFQAAFDSFFTLCQQTLNPNISITAVDEMLVQHLLTERLIRKIFDNSEFTRWVVCFRRSLATKLNPEPTRESVTNPLLVVWRFQDRVVWHALAKLVRVICPWMTFAKAWHAAPASLKLRSSVRPS